LKKTFNKFMKNPIIKNLGDTLWDTFLRNHN
jgi:hypothetical protein